MSHRRTPDPTPGVRRRELPRPGRSSASRSTPGSPSTSRSPASSSAGSSRSRRSEMRSPERPSLGSASASRSSPLRPPTLLSESITSPGSLSVLRSSGVGSWSGSCSLLSGSDNSQSSLSRESTGTGLLLAKGNCRRKWVQPSSLRTGNRDNIGSRGSIGGGDSGMRSCSSMVNLTVKCKDAGLDLVDDDTRRLLESLPLPEKYLQPSVPEPETTDDDRSENGGSHLYLERDSDISSVTGERRPPPGGAHRRGGVMEDNFFKGSSSSRAESIPTAHVSPNSVSRRQLKSSTSSTSLYRHAQSEKPAVMLRRAVSSRDFTSDIRLRSASPPASSSNACDADLLDKMSGTRRWSSHQNLQTPDIKENGPGMSEICIDPTLSESLLNEHTSPQDPYTAHKQHHPQGPSGGSHGTGAIVDGVHAHQPEYTKYLSVGNEQYPHHQYRRMGGEDASSGRLNYGGSEYPTSYTCYMDGGSRPTCRPTHPSHHPGSVAGYNVGAPPGGMKAYHHLGGPSPSLYGSNVGQLDAGYGSLHYDQPASNSFMSDITSWQQRHQEQLRRQHSEAAQPPTTYPPQGLSHDPTSLTGLTSMIDPHKLDAVRMAADRIIREKDNIIEKQKVRIVQLEQQNKAQEDSESLRFKLQKMEYECVSLKAQLAEVASKSSSMADMEHKLGECEYELRGAKASFEKDLEIQAAELESTQAMVAAKDSVLSEWKEKYTSQKTECDALERKMTSLERYLKDLPTADDHSKKSSEVRQLKEEKVKYKARLAELERRLEETNKMLKQKQEVLTDMTTAAANTTECVQVLKMEASRLRMALGLKDGEAAPLKPQEAKEELRFENDRLKADVEKIHKLLEAKHKKQQVIEVRHRAETKTLEERLAGEESTVEGLKEELATKEHHLNKLKASIKRLGSQNQDLLQKNMSLDEQQRETELHLTGEAQKLQQRLLKEMAVCFTELQSLVQICVQRAEGQDLNISTLLGIKSILNLDPDDAQPAGNNLQSLKYKVTKIHQLRQDIDNLRELISNKYAEDMGNKLNCATQ